jgi:hypothetical protein
MLPYDRLRYKGIARLREVARGSAANEAPFSRGVEPSIGFAVGDDRAYWPSTWLGAPAPAVSAPAAVLLGKPATAAFASGTLPVAGRGRLAAWRARIGSRCGCLAIGIVGSLFPRLAMMRAVPAAAGRTTAFGHAFEV